jgi:hypothetical protein
VTGQKGRGEGGKKGNWVGDGKGKGDWVGGGNGVGGRGAL